MKILFILTISFLLFAEDWDSKFAEVCKRDAMCSRLKASDGTWFKPKPEIIALLKHSDAQLEIKNTAIKYGVDPVAVAGAIVAENSLNVGVKDSVQTWLAGKMGITNIAGKNFSFGLGQISLPAAREAENYLARIENRASKSDSELTQEIADPMGSIRIAATIIRKVQDDYKNQGFDISKDPGILASLYNLGQSEKRAKEAKAEGRLPQVNYFGLFVNKYSQDIRSAAKVTQATPINLKPQVPNTSEVASKKTDMTPPLITSKAEKINKNLIKTDIVTKSVSLVSAPLLCESSDYGQDVVRETKSSSYGAPVAALDKDESYVEVSRTLDCKSNIWKLIKGRDDKIGWIQDEQLEKVKSTKLETKRTCTRGKSETTCQQSIAKSVGDLGIDSKNSDGLVYIKPISNTKDGKISFKNEDFNCGNKTPETTARNSKSLTAYRFGGSKPDISTKELKSISEELNIFANKELIRMSKELKLPVDQLHEPENPYSAIASQLENIKSLTQACLRTLSSETIQCQDPRNYSKEYKDMLEKNKYEKSPSLMDVAMLNQNLSNIIYQNQNGKNSQLYLNTYSPNEDELRLTTPEEIRESISYCEERIGDLKKSTQAQQKSQIANQNQGINPSYTSYPSYPYGRSSVGFGGIYGGYGAFIQVDHLFNAARKATDEQIKKYSSEFVGFVKFCHARMNLLEANKKQNRFNCTQAPKYLSNGFQLYTKEIVAKLYQQNPSQLLNEVQSGASMFVGQDILNDILGVQATAQPLKQYNNDYNSSYCPNKTAEYIEELVKNNPCIKHVFVPTRYLSNKLSNLDSKVIYRLFEEDGKYAIEIGDGLCKE
ncbi:MAG: DUF1402 family protein [Pseudobdellovibrio sp.]